MAFVETTAGIALPCPAFESGQYTIATNVDGARNANGTFVGQVVGDDKLKIEMSFKYLTPEEMQRWLAIFDRKQGGKFVQEFRVFDPRVNDFVNMNMYVGDRSGRPYRINATTFRPEFWVDVKGNLIEV